MVVAVASIYANAPRNSRCNNGQSKVILMLSK
jgi:hypothetical protein